MSDSAKDLKQLTKKSIHDAGLDICSNENVTVLPHDSKLISTGLYLEVPAFYVGLVWPRSGLSVKNKVEVGAGCIDAGYRGEVKIHLYNFSDINFEVKRGDRIAQLLTIPINVSNYTQVDKLSETERGISGFGSSGVK